MPILDIEIVLRDGESLPPNLASKLAEAAAQVFRTPPGRTWVRLKPLLPENYAEDGGGPPDGIRPVFVSVLKAERPEAVELEIEIAGLTGAVARICDRSRANVHVFYEPDAKGRVAFGGKIVPD
jgi:phenylpyruvate tautomerase PptA (4-oxalocrotonate tautomerase family)